MANASRYDRRARMQARQLHFAWGRSAVQSPILNRRNTQAWYVQGGIDTSSIDRWMDLLARRNGTACHCGKVATEKNGNGMEDTCTPCLLAWWKAGEPEACPCAEVAA